MSLYQISRDKLTLHLHPGQTRAWESSRRFIGMIAGNQSGKTEFLPVWLWREMQRCGPGDYGFICPTFTLMELKALPAFRRFFEQTLKLGSYVGSPVRRFTVSPEGEQRLFGAKQSTPTQVYFGYAENPDSLESATYKAVVCDEAGQKSFKRESYEALLRRLSIHQGRMLIGTTPYGNFGWLKTEIYDRWKAGDPVVDCIQFASTMNPAYPRAEFERAVATLPAWKVNLFYRGIFDRPAGMIYDCWDDAIHKFPRFTIPDEWRRLIGLDFGGVNTAGFFIAEELAPAATWGAPQRATGRFFAYREYKAGGRTARDHKEELLKGEPRLPQAVGGAGSEDQWRQEFAAAGLPVSAPRIREVEVGIGRVYGALKRRELLIFDDLKNTIDEFGSYSRELDDAGNPTEKIAEKETYHLLDAARYIVSWVKGQYVENSAAAGRSEPARPDVRQRPGGDAERGGRGEMGGHRNRRGG